MSISFLRSPHFSRLYKTALWDYMMFRSSERTNHSLEKKKAIPQLLGEAGIQCYRHSRGSGNPVLLPTLIEKLRKKFLFFLDEFI
jgi:hypothetical protein